jgi:hypothetical protein
VDAGLGRLVGLVLEPILMLAIFVVALFAVGAAWGNLTLRKHLEILQAELDIVMFELNKLRLESASGKLPRSAADAIREKYLKNPGPLV